MEVLRLGKSVQKVVQVQKDSSGGQTAVVLYTKTGGKKKKGSAILRPMNKATQRFAKAQQAFANSYLARHNKSNQKKKDGWLEDLSSNVLRAGRRGTKKLRIKRLLPI